MPKTLPKRLTLPLETTKRYAPDHPVIEVVPGEGGTYLWVGSKTVTLGTLWNLKHLRALRDALNIVLAVGQGEADGN